MLNGKGRLRRRHVTPAAAPSTSLLSFFLERELYFRRAARDTNKVTVI